MVNLDRLRDRSVIIRLGDDDRRPYDAVRAIEAEKTVIRYGLCLAKTSGSTPVTIDSTPGEGTTIMLLLPRSTLMPCRVEHHLVDLSGASPQAVSRGAMLLVDDDNEVAALVTEMLRELGWGVARAASAEAALGALANDRDIALVFSDIMMPGGMNGVELAREIRRRRPSISIVLTSGYSEAAAHDARAEGINLLPKPYSLEQLETALSAELGD